MKRFLPLLIIAVVALVTAGVAATFYRTKMQAASTPVAAVTPKAVPSAASGAAVATAPAPETFSHVRGPQNAPVTLEIYGDFQCPPCALVSQGIDEIQEKHKGQMRVVFHQFPLDMHAHAKEAALAAEAAAVQGKFWEMHDKLYENQPAWAEAPNPKFLFDGYAEALGLDVARFRADRSARDVRAQVREDIAAGDRRGVKATPTVFVNGARLHNGFTREELEKTIDAALPPKKNS